MNERVGTSPSTSVLTALTLLGFASNSLLCRTALLLDAIDPVSFTTLRLSSGAAALALLRWVASKRSASPGANDQAASVGANGEASKRSVNLGSALALFCYALGFSLAYERIHAGVGALLLFGAVQVTMLGSGLRRGSRPRVNEWLGLGIALLGLGLLSLPGWSEIEMTGTLLMLGAGVAWGLYSLRGRQNRSPLTSTSSHFAWAASLSLLVSVGTAAHATFSATGIALAVTSGAIASGLVYAVWYSVLRYHTVVRAALLQLLVPVLTLVGGIILLDESLTWRTIVAAVAMLSGVVLALARPSN